jgi:hypothetical protein
MRSPSHTPALTLCAARGTPPSGVGGYSAGRRVPLCGGPSPEMGGVTGCDFGHSRTANREPRPLRTHSHCKIENLDHLRRSRTANRERPGGVTTTSTRAVSWWCRVRLRLRGTPLQRCPVGMAWRGVPCCVSPRTPAPANTDSQSFVHSFTHSFTHSLHQHHDHHHPRIRGHPPPAGLTGRRPCL